MPGNCYRHWHYDGWMVSLPDMKQLLAKLNKGHWLSLGLACALAVVPIVAQAKPSYAGVAPGVLSVLAILKHAADTAEDQDGAQ